MPRILVILIAAFGWSACLLAGAKPTVLNTVTEQEIGDDFWLLAESGEPLPLTVVRQAYDQDTTRGIPLIERSQLKDTATYWMVGEITNQTSQAIWLLRLSFQGITHGTVYVENRDGRLLSALDIGVFQRRSGNAGYLGVGPKYNHAPIDLTKGKRYRIYVRIQNTKRYAGPITTANLAPFTPQEKLKSDTWPYLQGFMSGILILLIIFSAALFWLTRERSYFDYVWYLLATMIWAAFNHGMLREWLIASCTFVEPKYVFLLRSLIIFIPYLYLRFVWTLGDLATLFPKFSPWIGRLRYLVIGLFFCDWIWLLHSNFNFVLSNALMGIVAIIVLAIVGSFLPKLYQHRHDPLLRLILFAIVLLGLGLISPLFRLLMNGFRSIDGYELAIAQAVDLGIFATALGRKFRDFLRLSAENEVIRQLLKEKDILLKEVHHRVKNNLQVVSSLLRLQALHAKDAESKSALRESYHRLSSMSMIHEKLYQQDQMTNVNVQEYFGRLSNSLLQTYQIDDNKITLATDIDPIELDLETVMPIGLMLNELLSNALKHAFPNGQAGTIRVAIKQQGEGLFVSVADNGQGIPEGKELRAGSFGHQLIDAFARKLDGELEYQRSEGTTVNLHIKKLPTN